MADEESEFEHGSLQDKATVVRYLNAITEGFDNGSISLVNRGGKIHLKPKGMIDLTVRATHKRGRMQLTLNASWKNGDDENGNGHGKLVITPDDI
jgi:amphi-Trp domain-containing protein